MGPPQPGEVKQDAGSERTASNNDRVSRFVHWVFSLSPNFSLTAKNHPYFFQRSIRFSA
jgi:hypothetical protein